jgi:hypothetical protein
MGLLRMEYAIYSDKAVSANFSPLLLKRSFFHVTQQFGLAIFV